MSGITIEAIRVSGNRDSLLLERRSRDRKVASSNFRQERRKKFSSPELTFCADSPSIDVRSIPVLPQ